MLRAELVGQCGAGGQKTSTIGSMDSKDCACKDSKGTETLLGRI